MRTRLAFATATAYAADIVIIDEGIGAGDSTFAAKARDRLKGWLGGAGIVVMASHSEALLNANCDQTLRLEKGKIVSGS
jgi:ABC-2 type transport system ATP-binding protein